MFHAAGVMQYEPLSNQTPEQMRDILAAKMVGGWLLHRLLADIPLELFVLFSSSSSFLSSPMMGSYSAANVFLDALAHHRRATGKAALSINWGTWAEAGMATRFLATEESKRHRRTGIPKGVGVLSTQRALEALERLLEDGAVQAGVMSIDWKAWQRCLRRPRRCSLPFAADFRKRFWGGEQDRQRRQPPRAHSGRSTRGARGDGERLSGEEMARILKVPLASVDRETPIVNMGFDSLMSIELKNQIETDLGVSVAMARLLQRSHAHGTDGLGDASARAVRSLPTRPRVPSSVNEFEEGVL